MKLFDFTRRKLNEGGNLSLDNPDDVDNPYQADEIDLQVHNRTFMVGLLDKLLHDINSAFYAQTKQPIWNPQLLQSREFLGGSSLHFFNTKDISDDEFIKYKPKVGDIDTQCNKELETKIHSFLVSMNHKQIGDTTFLGFSRGNEQYNALFQFQDPPIKIQIDFEFGQYDTETDSPDEWFKFSHSSEWNDIQAGIKGVFHKWIYRALTAAHGSIKHQVDVLKTKTNITPNVHDNDLSFSVASGQGGGLSQKYEPYIHTDPTTGEKKTYDQDVPYKRLIPSGERNYIQKLDQQFYYFFGKQPEDNDSQLQKSFLGTLELINKYLEQDVKDKIFQAFVDICFEPGAQMITKDDPERDAKTKFAAIDQFVDNCKLKHLRPAAADKAEYYAKDFLDLKSFKEKNPPRPGSKKPMYGKLRKDAIAAGTWKPLAESINEAGEVKAQLRKGMPHLRNLNSTDFLDLLDELHQGNGQFQLKNIPLNVKVDGFGGRFGKNAEGKPFMGTSRTEPRYEAGFAAYHEKKGTTDPEVLGRAKLFDDLFTQMMNAIKLVDAKFGPDFLVNKQVTCEVLYLPFATETDEGKLKFVGIHYDKLPEGVQLALVPFRVVDAVNGEDLPNSDKFIKQLTSAGQQGSVMFIDNSLTQNEALDVTAIVPPLENIEQFKAMLASRKRDQAAEVKAALEPVKLALEQAIINDPNIVGKDLLGKDYEGIVINSRLGPIKVTSQEQRDVITSKNAAKSAARQEQPRGESKTAVVAIGSFVGHMGHQQLFKYTIDKAKEVGGVPYLFMGNAVGKDDPIPVADKIKTWKLMYPQYANNISAVSTEGGTLMQKVKHELINPLPGKPPRYDNVIIMVGDDPDEPKTGWPTALMKAVNKFAGYEHVKVSLEVTPRGTGMRFTTLRNALKQGTPEQQFKVWSDAFNSGNSGANPLSADWIKHLMDISRKGMGITQQPQVAQPKPAPQQRLSNALIRPNTPATTQDVAETKPMSTRDKFKAGLKRGGYDVDARAKEWDDEVKKSQERIADLKKQGYFKDEPTKEAMLDKSVFAGTKVGQKVGSAAHWKNTGPSKNRPARSGDLVGGDAAESVAEDNYDGSDLYSPEAIKIGSHFIKEFNLTNELDQQLAIEIVDNCLEANLTNPAQIRKQVIKYLKQSGTVIQSRNQKVSEVEGSPEGVPHLTKELLTHIIQQVGTEGAHAIVKSLKWGDGAAVELLQLITNDLKQNIAGMNETKRMSAAVKLQRAWDRERAKSSASYERERLRRELQGISDRMKPKEEPKKDDQGVAEAGSPAQQAAIERQSGRTVPNCVPVSEEVENIMAVLIDKIIVNEAIPNNKRRS